MLIISCVECLNIESYVRNNYRTENHFFLNSLGAFIDPENNYLEFGVDELITTNDIRSLLFIVDINCDFYKVLTKVDMPRSQSFNAVVDLIVNNYALFRSEQSTPDKLHLLSELFFIETFQIICSIKHLSSLKMKALLLDLTKNEIVKELNHPILVQPGKAINRL